MIFIVHTASPNYNDSFIHPIKKWEYIEEVEATDGHEACKKVRKEHPNRIFLDWWKKVSV